METQKVIVHAENPQQVTAPAIVQKPLPVVRQPSSKSKRKKVPGTRVSNRRYPARNCQKEDCSTEFIPTDSRQLYCCEQHRIDQNNDKRKSVNKIESTFTKQAKNNRAILMKIFNSKEYKNKSVIHYSVLDYEGFDFTVYHRSLIVNNTNRELKVCYDYGIMLSDSEKQYYKILEKQTHGF